MPSYSVIIPSYKRPAMLKLALESVFGQSLPPAEVYLVIDEPEASERYQFLESFGSALDVTYTGGGFGGAKARNVGLQKVQAEFVFFLDDDDVWLPNKIESQISFLESHQDYVGVTCWRRLVYAKNGLEVNVKPTEALIESYIRKRNYTGSFSFFGFRRNAETKDVFLDESLKAVQDHDFYIRIREAGKFGIIESVLARYNVHEGERISGACDNKLNSFTYLYDKYKSRFSFRERVWNYGQILVWRGRNSSSLSYKLGILSLATPMLILTFHGVSQVVDLLRMVAIKETRRK
ncbi:glycosyltransferase family 2 protein [Opitutales bacterium]|nr:glycosyltransferase family 2 protein [Opitutales bacterium]